MHAVVFLLVVAFGTPSYGQDSAELGPIADEHSFHCGAAFALMAKVYRETGDAKISAGYQTKFDKLATQAESIFEQFKRSKSDSEASMQKHVETLTALAEEDAALAINFARLCDQRFPG